MRNIVIAFMACAGLFFSCTQANVEENSTGTLTGIVADKTTGEPVSVVNVILTPGGNSTVTGSDGSFSFKNLKAGTYTISYTKDGYKGGSSDISVEAGLEAQAHLLIERIPAVLTLDRDVLDFGENASMNTLSFNMVNNNYIDLEYTIIENCGWIVDVDPETGVLPFGKTGTVVVKIDREAGLQPGMNETVIVVKTSDGSSELTVRATGIEKRKATLNVLDATEVMASSARLNAEITDAGAPSYTERGFVYSESPMPDFDNTIAKMSASVTDDKTFSVKIDGLELSRTYYVRAYAVNEIGDAFSSNQISFTTAASLPEVSLDGINTNVSEKSATLYGSITNDGDPEYYAKGFVYSTGNTYPTIYDTKIQVDGDNHGNFEASLPSIEYDTEYYVRAYATNVAGTAYSDMQKIMIETELPVVKTNDATDVDKEHDIAVLHGEIIDNGIPSYTEKGFVYSEIYESPTIYDSKIVVDGGESGLYEYRSTELSSDRQYYVRAYAINDKGVAYGDVIILFEKNWVELPEINIAVQKEDIGQSGWDNINRMCENSTVEGYTDWRLPTMDELYVIYNNRDMIGNFVTSSPNAANTCYWSSNPSSLHPGLSYYYLVFANGVSNFGSGGYRGRCVRTLTPAE